MADLLRIARALRPALSVRTLQGQPLMVGERQITPIARSVCLTVGVPHGPLALGWVWARPIAVLETWQGRVRRIPIYDATRLVLAIPLVISILLLLATASISRKRNTRLRRRA